MRLRLVGQSKASHFKGCSISPGFTRWPDVAFLRTGTSDGLVQAWAKGWLLVRCCEAAGPEPFVRLCGKRL